MLCQPRLCPPWIRRAPYVPVPPRGGRRGRRLHEPWVVRAGVVENQIDDDPEPAAMRLLDQPREVRVGPVVGVDRLVVGGVVSVIARRREHRHQPQRVDAQIGAGRRVSIVQVIESRDEPRQIAGAVSVRVLEAAHEDLVEHGARRPAPELVGGAGGRRATRDAGLWCARRGACSEGEADREARSAHRDLIPRSGGSMQCFVARTARLQTGPEVLVRRGKR